MIVQLRADCFDRSWRAATTVRSVTRQEAERCIRAHYLKKWPGVTRAIYALCLDDVVLGVVVFAEAPTQTSVRYGARTLELARLWVDDSVPRNGESYLISKAVKLLRADHPDVRVLVSYADPSVGHHGGIYRAAGWEPDGRTDEGRKTPRADYRGVTDGKMYSRASHIPPGVEVERVPRVSKPRFIRRI